jgi:hypothetical protein
MKYWLKDFEHNISPATWEAADQLSQSGSVRNLREIETHFWVARVDREDDSFETEVIITPQKIKAFSCECFTPGRRLMCVHIAASLLKIRQYLDKRAEERRAKAEASQSKTLNRINTQTVLENATASELEMFVRDYARRDRDFALALKTWFAGSITESDNPYALLLESVFPKTVNAKGAYRDPDFRRVRKALDGLEVQLNMAAEEGNFRGMFQISAAILMQSLPALEKLEGNRREALLHFCQLSLEKITEISERHLSVELRESAWQLVFDLGSTGLFPAEMQRVAIQFLSGTAAGGEKNDLIRNLFDTTPHPAPSFVLDLFLASLAVRQMPEAVPKVLEDFVETPEVIRTAILQLYYMKHWDAVLLAGTAFLSKQLFISKHQREVEDIVLFVAEQKGKQSLQLEMLRQRFMKSGNFEAFKKLKEVAGKKWPKVREKLVGELALRGEMNFLAAALAAEGQLDELAQLLDSEGSIAMLQRYETFFFQTQTPFLRALYVRLLSDYLDVHFGTPAAKHVRQRLEELGQKGQSELMLKIAKEILARYADRPSLPEELAELLPKAKRKYLFA